MTDRSPGTGAAKIIRLDDGTHVVVVTAGGHGVGVLVTDRKAA